jgi:hypothetical protein
MFFKLTIYIFLKHEQLSNLVLTWYQIELCNLKVLWKFINITIIVHITIYNLKH